MKTYLYLFFLLIFLYSCNDPIQDIDPPMDDIDFPIDTIDYKHDILLDDLKNNYINLKEYSDTIIITGTWKGDRIVLKNCSYKTILLINVYLISDHAEEALVIADDTYNMKLYGINANLYCGGFTIWGILKNSIIDGLNITEAHTGFKSSLDLAHSNDTIRNLNISKSSFEGVYFGPSNGGNQKLYNIVFDSLYIEYSGWDDFQIGNCVNCVLQNSVIYWGARKNVYGQNYLYTVNEGSLFYIKNTSFTGYPNVGQSLDSRLFIQNTKD